MLKKHWLWIIIIGIHLAFFTYRLVEGQVILKDSKEYMQAAENLERYGVLYSGTYEPKAEPDYRQFTKRPPVYPVFILVFSTLFQTTWAVLLLQNLMSIFNIWLVFKMLQHMGYENKKWLAAFLFLMTPAQLIYSNFLMSEILLQSLLLGFVYQMLKFIAKYELKPLLWGALLLILAMLTKPVMYPFVYIYLFVIIIYAVWLKKYKLIIAGIIPLMVLVGYQQINKVRTGYAHFSSISNINLLQYNAKYMMQNFYSIGYADSVVNEVQEKAAQKESYTAEQVYLKQRSIMILRNHKRAYTVFHVRGMVTFILDPGRFDLYNYFNVKSGELGFLHYISAEGMRGVVSYLKTQPVVLVILLIAIAILNLFKAILVMMFLFSKRINTEVKIILLGIIFYLAFLTGPLGASRFMLPVLPLIVMAICMVWDEVVEIAHKIAERAR